QNSVATVGKTSLRVSIPISNLNRPSIRIILTHTNFQQTMTNPDLIQNTPNTREPIPAIRGAKAFVRFFEAQQWTTYFLGMLAFLFGALLYFSVSGMLKGGSSSTGPGSN